MGGKNVSLAAFAPSVSPLIMGATTASALESDDLTEALYAASVASIDQIFDASFMSGLKELFSGYGSITDNLLTTGFTNAVSQNIPSMLKSIVQGLDPYVRDTKDKNVIVEILNKSVLQYIPGVRQRMGVKVDVTGEKVRNSKGGVLANLFNPFTLTDAENDPVVREVQRVYDETGVSGALPADRLRGRKNAVKDVAGEINGKDKQAYREHYGQTWHAAAEELISSEAYQMMNDTDRAKALKEVMANADEETISWAQKTFGYDMDTIDKPSPSIAGNRGEHFAFDTTMRLWETTMDERFAVQDASGKTAIGKRKLNGEEKAWYEEHFLINLSDELDKVYSGYDLEDLEDLKDEELDELAEAVKKARSSVSSKTTREFKKVFGDAEDEIK